MEDMVGDAVKWLCSIGKTFMISGKGFNKGPTKQGLPGDHWQALSKGQGSPGQYFSHHGGRGC